MSNTEYQNKFLLQDDSTLRRLHFLIDIIFALGILSFDLAFISELPTEVDTTAGDSLLKELQEEAGNFIQIALSYSIGTDHHGDWHHRRSHRSSLVKALLSAAVDRNHGRESLGEEEAIGIGLKYLSSPSYLSPSCYAER